MIDPKVNAAEPPLPTILICEDEEPLRELVRLSLGEEHRFVEASDGTTALDLLREHRPSLVVLDVMLPGLNGLEVLNAIRGDPELSATRVLAVSAWVHLEGEALAAGADSFLRKPFDPEHLRARVLELLAVR